MPDITMCDSDKCPLREGCYRNPRSGTEPSVWRQSWITDPAAWGEGETEACEGFMERRKR